MHRGPFCQQCFVGCLIALRAVFVVLLFCCLVLICPEFRHFCLGYYDTHYVFLFTAQRSEPAPTTYYYTVIAVNAEKQRPSAKACAECTTTVDPAQQRVGTGRCYEVCRGGGASFELNKTFGTPGMLVPVA